MKWWWWSLDRWRDEGWGWWLREEKKKKKKKGAPCQLLSAAPLLLEWGSIEENGDTHLLAYSCQDRWRPFWPDLRAGGGSRWKGEGGGEGGRIAGMQQSKQQISKEPPCMQTHTTAYTLKSKTSWMSSTCIQTAEGWTKQLFPSMVSPKCRTVTEEWKEREAWAELLCLHAKQGLWKLHRVPRVQPCRPQNAKSLHHGAKSLTGDDSVYVHNKSLGKVNREKDIGKQFNWVDSVGG